MSWLKVLDRLRRLAKTITTKSIRTTLIRLFYKVNVFKFFFIALTICNFFASFIKQWIDSSTATCFVMKYWFQRNVILFDLLFERSASVGAVVIVCQVNICLFFLFVKFEFEFWNDALFCSIENTIHWKRRCILKHQTFISVKTVTENNSKICNLFDFSL